MAFNQRRYTHQRAPSTGRGRSLPILPILPGLSNRVILTIQRAFLRLRQTQVKCVSFRFRFVSRVKSFSLRTANASATASGRTEWPDKGKLTGDVLGRLGRNALRPKCLSPLRRD